MYISAPVHSSNTFSHCSDTISKWEQWMQILEEGRGHLDWIGSGGTWNLQNYQYDTQCFSDMFECKGKSINNIYIYERADCSRQY